MTTRKSRDTLEELHDFNIDKNKRIIYVSSDPHFEEEAGVDYRMCDKFIKNLDYLESSGGGEIIIKMMTCGGDWNYGMAMFDAIANSKCHITTVSYAHARSMSSIIIQAADKRLISSHADFMVHYGTYGDEGDFRKVANGIKYYDKTNDVMFNIYANRCQHGQYFKDNKMKLADVKNYIKQQVDMKTDWWLSAEEAVYFGFVDEVI